MDKLSQIANYDRIWCRFSDPSKVLYRNQAKKEHVTLTANIAVNGQVAQNLHDCAANLQRQFPAQEYQSKDTYHITLVAFQKVPKEFDPAILDQYKQRIAQMAHKIPSFELEFAGMNHFPDVVFAQVFANDQHLQNAYDQIQDLRMTKEFDFVPHSSMIHFRQNPAALFKEVEKHHRSTYFGKMRVTHVDLVKWLDHVPYVLERFDLNG